VAKVHIKWECVSVCTKCWVLQGETLELHNKQWCTSVRSKSLLLRRTKFWCMCNTDTQYGCQILTSHIGVCLIPFHAWVLKERIMKIWCIVYMKLSHEFT
jgi:hypothetical protein